MLSSGSSESILLLNLALIIEKWAQVDQRSLQRLETMRIITSNLNGIRSAATKGFFDWMRRQNADVICLQEVKA
jgi:hypothetical protein